jgi:hypothetical protein
MLSFSPSVYFSTSTKSFQAAFGGFCWIGQCHVLVRIADLVPDIAH